MTDEFHSETEEAQVSAVSEHAQVSAVSEEAQVFAVSWAAIVAGGVASAALTLVAGLSQAAGSAAGQSAGPVAGFVDSLLRADPAATPSTGDVVAPRDELYRLFTSSLSSGGDFAPADRTYMAQVVAARTGLNQADAEKRVSHVIALAKSAADNARKTAAQFALWSVCCSVPSPRASPRPKEGAFATGPGSTRSRHS